MNSWNSLNVLHVTEKLIKVMVKSGHYNYLLLVLSCLVYYVGGRNVTRQIENEPLGAMIVTYFTKAKQ